MATIERAIGGAGTGKTRLILDKLSEAKKALRLSVDEIGFCTFTRAGRAEISERASEAWMVSPDRLTRDGWFRTCHSIAHRQCGVEDGQLIQGKDGDEWMSGILGGTINTRIDSRGERTYVSGGDDTIPVALRAWELARSTLSPLGDVLARWIRAGEPCPSPEEISAIIEAYERGKKVDGRLDYTDMIARFAGVRFTLSGPERVDPVGEVPESLRILAIDEAQDSSALVDLVCRRLASGERMERIWITGDPYQSIHGFAGGDFRHFLSWDASESIMPQSYRCPDQVLTLGESCLRMMTQGYRERNIRPASHQGEVSRMSSVDEAMANIGNASVLVLGRCAYSLAEYEAALIDRGVPHCWIDKTHGSSVLSGYKTLWTLQNGGVVTGDGWRDSISMLAVNSQQFGQLLTRGEKKAWEDGRRNDIDLIRPTDDDLSLAGAQPPLVELIRTGRWHLAVEPKSRDRAEKWLRAATQFGPDEASNPRVKLSTIHGAKGLEADTVILSSITSPRIERARANLPESHDEECRIAYVAVTRARRRLIYVEDGLKYRMEIPV